MWSSNTRWVVEVSYWSANSCLDQRHFPWPDKQLFLISKFPVQIFFLDGCLEEVWLCKSQVSCVALFRRLFSQAVEIKSEKLGIHANSEYQPFYNTDWHLFVVNGNLRPGILLPCFDSILRKYIYIYFLLFLKETIQCLLGINVGGFRKFNKV